MSNCISNPIYFNVQSWINAQCVECQQSTGCLSSTNICYNGANLPCSGIDTGDTIETALQKIDTQICSAIGDYSNYQFNCLTAWWEQAITQESEFVDAITAYTCEIVQNLESFTGTTFPAFEDATDARFESIEGPGITCVAAGVVDTDDLNTILAKYCTKFGDLDTALDLSSVPWNSCFTVISTPTTVVEGFTTLSEQICQVKTIAEASATLPTFNNVGSCLASPGSSDTLVATINKLKTRVCLSPTWNSGNITWGCVEEPETLTDLEEAIQNIVTNVSDLLTTNPTFSGDFVVEQTDPEDSCAGVTISLATPVNIDRYVASNPDDTSPATLIEKLTAGTNITLDDSSTPGQVIINSTSGDGDHLVLADPSDTTPGYLIDKINGATSQGVTLITSYNGGTEQVDITPSINMETLFDLLLDALDSNPTLYAKFCEKVANCPSTCTPPTNIQAVVVP